jgi:hypothetical protein
MDQHSGETETAMEDSDRGVPVSIRPEIQIYR